ncbi:SPOR domain-containing protein [Tsuneonella mangrovi]|uniref:SPOR domain-containing protein n=1 Tax=Tsuneonella mangrovi TaxID=1982042 RepID=UPI001F0ACB32|nr:SPOR domain-containing protein [Tsuneonella mangrovi]
MAGAGNDEDPIDLDGDEHEELALADDEERLPWLESDEDYAEEGAVDTGRIVGFALLALLALAVIVGLIWWIGQRGHDKNLVADGSTIAAPKGDYKAKPENPGGRKFEGTGNVAPAVGEGQTKEGRLATDSAPKPSIDTGDASGSSTGGVAVQVGAYSSQSAAESGWNKLASQTDKLSGVRHRIVQGQADIGTVYRLQAMASDLGAANALCAALKGDGIACQVKP